MKTFRSLSLSVVLALTSVFALTTCKDVIGLGGAVDINPPIIRSETIYPPLNAVVRDSFLLSVVVDDDRKVDTVSALLTCLEGGADYTHQFILEQHNNQWQVYVDRSKNHPKYKPVDGLYMLRITARDASGKEVDIESRLVIDNTPPLLVLQRPSTAVAGAPAAGTADIFGDAFFLAGQVYDSCPVESLQLTAQPLGGGEANTITLKNIPQTIRMTVDSFSAADSVFYKKLYGNNQRAGNKTFSYGITVTDSARLYQNLQHPEGSGEGNSTETYYLYEDLYQDVLSKHKIDKVYTMTRKVSHPDGRSVDSGVDTESVKQVLDKLKEKAITKNGERKGFFALNPSINPKYGIEGHSPKTIPSTGLPPSLFDTIYENSTINVKLSPNFDEDPLNDANAYELYLIDVNAYKAAVGSYSIDVNTAQDLAQLYTDASHTTLKPFARKLEVQPENISKSGSSHIMRIKLPSGLEYEASYILQVRGSDQKDSSHTMIADPKEAGGNMYGFRVIKNGKRPEVKVETINGKPDSNGRFYIKKGDSARFPVTHIENLLRGSIHYELTGGAVPVTGSLDYPAASGNITFEIPSDTFAQDKSAVYKLRVWAVSTAGVGDSLPAECQIYYDVEGPVITANVPSLVTAMPEIAGDIYDAGSGVDFTSISAVYKYETDAPQPLPFAESANAGNNNWKLAPISNPKEGAYEIVLTAKDTLGQSGKENKMRFVYDTAKPVLRDVNGITLDLLRKGQKITAGSTSLTLTGSIAEKNKIKSLKIGKKGSAQETVSAVLVSGSTDTYTFTKTFDSLPEGDCTFVIDVEDAAGKTDTAEITAVVDTAPPQFKKMKIGVHEFKADTMPNPFNGTTAQAATRTPTVPISGEFEDKGQGVKELRVQWTEGSEQKEEVFTAVPVEGKPNWYKAEGAITLAHTHSEITFIIKDGSGKTTQWKSTVIRSNETLSVGMRLTAPSPAPYTQDDTPYVKTAFTLQLTGTYNGEEPQDLELRINKDGAVLTAEELTALQPQVVKGSAAFSGIQRTGNTISGFKSGIKTNESEVYSVTFTPRADHQDDGRYVFTFKSTAGDVQSQQSVWVDTESPDLTPRVPVDGQSLKEEPKLFAVISDTPGAGIKSVTAKLNGTHNIELVRKGSSVESKQNLTLNTEATHTILFTYSDHLGNANSETITFQYDKTPPVLSDILIDGKDGDTVLIGVTADGKMKQFPVKGHVQDTLQMSAVYLTITNKKTGAGVSLARKPKTGKNTKEQFDWLVEHDTLKDIISPEGLYTLSIRAEDKAGFITTVIKNVVVDKDKPVITVKTPAPSSTVNKTITVSGTASDKQQLKSVKVVKKGSPGTALAGVSDSTGGTPSKAEFTKDSAGVWSFKLDTTQEVPITSEPGTGSIILTVIAEDEVGNITEQDHTITVDQNQDRPVITITSFEHIASAQLSSSKILTGTVSDDDGILNDLAHDLEIKIGSGAYKAVTFGSGGSFWTYSLENLADGDHTIHFKVKDAAGNTFSTENTGNKLVRPNVTGKADTLTAGKDTGISFKLDNTPPQIKSDDVRFVLGSSLAALAENSDDTKVVPNKKIGNENNKQASFRVFVKDSSGIDAVKLSLGNGAGQPLTKNSGKDKDDWEAWEVSAVPLTEGTHVLKLEVKDKSGFPNFWQETVVCDFTKPSIIMQNPPQETGNWAKELLVGKTVLSGSFSDTASGINADAAAYSCTIGTGKSALLAGDTFTVSPSGLSWTVELADASLYGTTVYSAERLKPDLTVDSNGKIYKVPLYLTAQDGAGNIQPQEFYLTIDSDGKTPKVSIYGPEQLPPALGESGADVHNGLKKVTLGGTVRFYGDAAVNKPSSGAKVVSIEARFSPNPHFTESFSKEVSAGLPDAGMTKEWKDGVPVVNNASGNGITSWNFTIDSSKFLTGIVGGTVDLYYSIRAKNDEGTYSDWTPARKIKLDQNAPIFHEQKILKGSQVGEYISGTAVADGNYLKADLISTTGITSIAVEVANAGTVYDGLRNLTTESAILAAKVGGESVFTKYTPTDGKSGYTMKLPLKTAGMTDPDQNCKITVTITGGQANGSIPNFNQFNLKYDNSKPAVVFGVPEGEGGLGVFTTTGATGIEAARAGMDITDLYVFAATKDGSAKEIKVTGIGEKTLSYAAQSDIFAQKSEYILFRKDAVVFDNPEKYQLEGIIYDTGSGVDSVVPTLAATAFQKITKFTSLQGQFASFKEGIKTSTLDDGKKELKVQVTDKAGNSGAEYKTDVLLRNKPLKIEKVHFNTDLNGDNTYADDSAKGLVELVTEAGHDSNVDEHKNYTQKIDIKNRFTFKNAAKSQIAFELAGGQGTSRTFELHKADASGKPAGALLKSGTFTGNGAIDLATADFGVGKIPEGANQTFAIVLKDDASTSDTDRKLTFAVTLNVRTEDKSKPQVVIMPFYWNSETDNSLSGNSRANGHIELGAISALSNIHPSVSGKVVLRGTAYHPTKLTKLELTGTGPTITVTYANGTWASSSGLTVTDTAFDVHGHWVRWEYVWTTGSPALDKTVTMKAYHKDSVESLDTAGSAVQKTAAARPTVQSLTLAAGDTAVAGQFLRLHQGEQSYLVTITAVNGQNVEWKLTNVPVAVTAYELYSIGYTGDDNTGKTPVYSKGTLSVNVVPYISKIETFISESAGADFARSALGSYPVRAGEVIKLYGFNLTQKPVVKMNSKSLKVGNKTATEQYYPVTVEYDPAVFPAEDVKSGDLEVVVGTVPAINNSNAAPSFDNAGNPITAVYNVQPTDANKRLTDNLSLSVWKIEDMGISKDITSPMLKVDSKSNWYMSYGKGVPRMVVNKNGTETIIDYSYNKFHNTAVAFDNAQNIYALATNTDRVDDNSAKFSFYSRAVTQSSGNSSYGSSWTGKSRLELVFNQDIYNINRVKRPKITATGDTSSAKMYIAYFDSNDSSNPVKFRYGTVNSANAFSDGLVDQSYSSGAHVIANKTTKYQGGEYTAVGVTSTGRAVVAWYDASAKRLVYSWNDTPQTIEAVSDTSKWQTNAKEIDKGYAGWYVDLTVDKNDGIHIAYYNSAKGDLKYAYLSTYNAAPQVVTVDSYLSVGTQIMITTREENAKIVPYISYYHASFSQTPSAVRVAWRSDLTALSDGVKHDSFTGKWEAMTIPVTDIPKDETICNGVPTEGTWKNTMIVGFMTDAGYKKAVLQK